MSTINVRNMSQQQIKDLGLSFYTLSKFADAVRLVYPWSIVELWERGLFQEFKGELTLDELGNFVAFN